MLLQLLFYSLSIYNHSKILESDLLDNSSCNSRHYADLHDQNQL